jgi:hypothetical protein
MKVGDLLLVTGTAFFEKTKIVDRNKGIYTLENGVKTDRTLHPLNSTYKVEPFDEEKYKNLMAQRLLTRNLEKLTLINNKGIENPEIVRYAANKLSRILEKLEEK